MTKLNPIVHTAFLRGNKHAREPVKPKTSEDRRTQFELSNSPVRDESEGPKSGRARNRTVMAPSASFRSMTDSWISPCFLNLHSSDIGASPWQGRGTR